MSDLNASELAAELERLRSETQGLRFLHFIANHAAAIIAGLREGERLAKTNANLTRRLEIHRKWAGEHGEEAKLQRIAYDALTAERDALRIAAGIDNNETVISGDTDGSMLVETPIGTRRRLWPIDKSLLAERDALRKRVEELEGALMQVDFALRVPAAEYVPAIGEAFMAIDRVLPNARERKDQP